MALVTTGPGGTNAITGVAAAWLDSTPCLFLSGQVKRADLLSGRGVRQMGFQELDIVDIVRPITKHAVRVDDPSSIRYQFDKALFLAKHGRPGPVWLDIPLDVQAAEVEETSLPGFDPPVIDVAEDPARLLPQVREAIRLLNQAQRPVILVGNGVRLAGAVERFLALAEMLNVPVLTTWKAMDFLAEDHPLYIGRPGAVGQRAANFAQQNADWMLILGARLDLGQTAYNHRGFARARTRSSWMSIRRNLASCKWTSTCRSAPTPARSSIYCCHNARRSPPIRAQTGGRVAGSGRPVILSS